MKKADQILLVSAFLLTFMITKSINVVQDTEIWRVIPSLDGTYAVSNLGNVKNLKTGRILKPWFDKGGYNRVTFPNRKKEYVHRLILLSFNVPNPENKSDVNHKNGNPSDNRLENLEWATRMENVRHSLITGLHQKGNGHVILSAEIVRNIRYDYKPRTKGLKAALADKYNIQMKHLNKILYREIWKYV